MANNRTFPVTDAQKLDDPERLTWLPPGDIIVRLQVLPAMKIADIGSGTGFLAIPLARKIGPGGLLYAVDMQREMLAILKEKLSSPDAPPNIVVVNGDASHTTLLHNSCDLVVMANLWHELDDQGAALKESARILRSNGRLAILDWRTDVTRPPGPPIEHRISMLSVQSSLVSNKWTLEHSAEVGTYSYLVVASRAAGQTT